jgi:hypothetical protein
MSNALFDEVGKVSGVTGDDMAQVNRAKNYSLLTGLSHDKAFDSHDEIQEVVKEKKTFYGELQKARAKDADAYNPLKTFNDDAPDGVCPVTGTTAKDHAALWYPFVKGFVDTGMGMSEGFNQGMATLFDRLDKVGSFLGRHLTGDENNGKGGAFREAAGYFQNKYKIVKSGEGMLPEPVGPVAGFVGETVGGAVPGIASFILDKVFAGPASGQEEIEKRKSITAQNKADFGQNVETAFDTPEEEAEFAAFCKGAIERGLMGSILHAMSGLYRPYRVTGTGALFGAQEADNAEEFNVEDFGKAIITGGIFGTMGGKGKFGMRDVTDEMVRLNAEMGERGSVGGKKTDIENIPESDISEPMTPKKGTGDITAKDNPTPAAEAWKGFISGPVENSVKIYRGNNAAQKEHSYYSPSKEWARNFTQSGQDKEIIETFIKKDDVYVKSPLPQATDALAEETAINEAMTRGFKAVMLSEGKNEPPSIYRIPKERIKNFIPAKTTPQAEAGIKKIYHGTDKSFTDFDITKTADGSIWFTDDINKINSGDVVASGRGKIVKRYVDENKLKLGGWEESDKYSTDQLISMGYDGLKLVDDGETTYQIFNPEKLLKKLPNPSRPPEVGGQSARGVADILKDINAVVGKERGSMSGEELSPEAQEARNRLIQDIEKFKEEAKATGKDLSDYLAEKGIDPKTAEALLGSQLLKQEHISIPTEKELSERIQTLKTELAHMEVNAVLGNQDVKNIKNLIRIETGQVKAGDLLVKEYTALTAGMKKAEQASKAAFREGKKEGIAAEKQKELEAALRLKARMEARQEVKDIITDLKDVQKNVSTMTPFNADNITELLDCLDLTKLSAKKELKLTKTREFLQNNPDAELPDYVMDDLARLDKTPARDLTFDELQSVHKAIMQYAHQSEMVQKLWDGRELKDKKEVLKNVVSEMDEPGEKMGKLISLKPTVMDSFRSWGDWMRQTLGIRQDSYHLIVESISGINSTVHRVLSRDINKGTDNQKRYYQSASEQFKTDLKAAGFEGNKSDKYGIKNVHDWINEFVTVKIGGADVEIRRGQKMSIYRHSLNEDNYAAMTQGGIGFKQTPKGSKINPNTVLRPTDQDIQKIVDGMTPAEKAFAGSAVDNLFNNQWKNLNDVFVRVNRYRLDKQQNYFPKDVMPLNRGGLNLESEEGLEAFRQFTARVGIEKGMLIQRQGSKAPIYINDMMHDITVSLEKSAGYIGLEEPMRRASALLYNPEFQREMIGRYGRETWVEIEKGLKDISGTARQFNETEKGIMKLKTNAVSSILSLNPWIWANQPFGMLMFEPYVEMKYLMKGVIDAATKPTETLNTLKAHSPMLVDRLAGGYDRDLAAKFQQSKDTALYDGGSSLTEKGLTPTKWFDVGSIVPGMQGATYKALAEFESGKLSNTVSRALDITDADAAKMTPEQRIVKAHEFADWVVENTQAMGGKEHHAPIQRGGVAEQIMTSFGSQTNAMLNLTRRTYRQWQRTKDPEDKKTFVKAACQVFLVNALAMTLLDRTRAALYNRDPKSFIESMVDNAAGVMFIVRDLEKTLVSHLQKGRQGYDAKWPVTRAVELIANMGADINTIVTSKNAKNVEDAWLSFIDNNVALAAISTGLPYDAPKQVLKATFGDEEPRKKYRDGVIDEIENEITNELGIEEE